MRYSNPHITTPHTTKIKKEYRGYLPSENAYDCRESVGKTRAIQDRCYATNTSLKVFKEK